MPKMQQIEHVSRYLDLRKESKSMFLFGPRQTGKSSLLKRQFPGSVYYDLLHSETFFRLSGRPSLLREEILALHDAQKQKPIVVDEIQKLPILLNEIHALIESENIQFILTGSSARKLRQGGVNLLGGRARLRHLFPFTTQEIGQYDLLRILNVGALPSIYFSDSPQEDLASYLGTYLQQEIIAEGLTRGIVPFSKFLSVAGLSNGELINFEKVSQDSGVPRRTVMEYFQILEDTLIGTVLHPFVQTKSGKQAQSRKTFSRVKFYLFDVGVANRLAKRTNIEPKTELFGKVLEHFIFTELRACLSYLKDVRELSFWRTYQQDEVDFLIGDEVAIEIKATSMVIEKHLKGLKKLSEETNLKHRIVVSLDERPRLLDGVRILPVKEFLTELWETHAWRR